MEQPCSIQNIPPNTVVELGPEIGSLVHSYYRGNRTRYGIVKAVSPYYFREYSAHVSLELMGGDGRQWQPMNLYVQKDWTATPVKEEIARRIQKLHEKSTLTNVMRRATAETTMSGSDPEIFVVDKKTKKVIPAFMFLQDKKHAKYHPTSEGYGITPFWDGFQAEFSMKSFSCMEWMATTIRGGLLHLLQTARTRFPDAQLSPDSVVEIDLDFLANAAEHHAALGCSKSFNVYGTPAVRVENPRLLPFRFAGGHMHFGDPDLVRDKDEKIQEYVKILDALVGVASVLWYQELENPIRRQFYGRAGEYRRPHHGLEYRTPGNGWLRHPALFHLTYGYARTALRFARSGLGKYLDFNPEQVREVVDSYDVKSAREIVRKNKAVIKSIFRNQWAEAAVKVAYDAFDGGLAQFMHDPDDLERNWHFSTPWHPPQGGVNSEWSPAGCSISEGRKI